MSKHYSPRQKRQRKKRFYVAASSVVLLAVIIFGVYWLFLRPDNTKSADTGQQTANTTKDPTVNLKPPTDAQKQAGDQIKDSQQAVQNGTGANTPPPATTTLTISRLSQPAAGQAISLRTILSANLSGATCVITFIQTGQPDVTQTASVVSNPTYYSCAPVDIPASTFSAGGTWQATVYVQKDGTAVSNKATRSVTIYQ